MTLDELRTSDSPVLIPKDIAPLLGCDPYAITRQAKECPEKLGFPVCVVGRRVKIPRAAFLKWFTGGKEVLG